MGFVRTKLKKRLRKKYHLGEFQELGFKIYFSFESFVSEEELNLFLEEFIDEIERNTLLFGGSGDKKNWEGFVTSAEKFNSPTDEQRNNIDKWLKNRSDIENVKLDELTDVWHGWN